MEMPGWRYLFTPRCSGNRLFGAGACSQCGACGADSRLGEAPGPGRAIAEALR